MSQPLSELSLEINSLDFTPMLPDVLIERQVHCDALYCAMCDSGLWFYTYIIFRAVIRE